MTEGRKMECPHRRCTEFFRSTIERVEVIDVGDAIEDDTVSMHAECQHVCAHCSAPGG